jgi:hypothetical protein
MALAVTQAVDRGAGVLYSYGRYQGDILNFDMAAELMADEGIQVETVLVTDDVASAPKDHAGEWRGPRATSSRRPGRFRNRLRTRHSRPPLGRPGLARESPQDTLTVPCMNEWIEQWYLNVPCWANVNEKLLPGVRFPLSKDPLSAVTVWVVLSSLLQATFWPAFALVDAGWKAKFWIVVAVEPLDMPPTVVVEAAVDGAVVVGDPDGLLLLEPPHPAAISAPMASSTSTANPQRRGWVTAWTGARRMWDATSWWVPRERQTRVSGSGSRAPSA